MANKKIIYDIGFNVESQNLQQLRTELSEIQRMSVAEFKIHSGSTGNISEVRAQLEGVKHNAKQVEDALKSSFNPKLNTINLEKFKQELGGSFQELSRIENSFKILGDKGSSAFNKLTTSLLTSKREVKQTSKLMDSLIQTLSNTVKWSLASSAVNMFTGTIQKAWNYAIKLDKSLNDIRIVTNKSAEDMEKFADRANKAAKALGSSTNAYAKASLIYYQQGLEEEDVQARTDVTVKAANVTGQSAAEVSEQLTAVWNGYKVVAEDAEKYIDKLSAVAATTAADLEELSEGMSKVASGANAMGVDIDQLTAQLATIVSVTRQDASSVGTALKTIFARMGDLKVDGVDEFGVSLGEVSGTLKQVGIEVLDQEGNLRDMGDVMEEVAGKWGTWTEAQQQAIAVAMAGKRQYNNLLALFENWDMYESALSTSQNSEGTLQKQQDIYMESTQAHLNQLAVAGEKVYDALFDSDSMRDFIDILTAVVDTFGEFVDMIGGGGNLLLLFGGIAGRVLGKLMGGAISNMVTNIKNASYNEGQYRAELELTQQLGERYAKTSEENQKKLIEIKKQHLKLEKFITEEQREQNRQNLENIAAAMEKQDAAVSTANDFDEQYRYMQGAKDTEKKTRKVLDFRASGMTDDSYYYQEAEEAVQVSTDAYEKGKTDLDKKEKAKDEKLKAKEENEEKIKNLEAHRDDLDRLRKEDLSGFADMDGDIKDRLTIYSEQKKIEEEILALKEKQGKLEEEAISAEDDFIVEKEKVAKLDQQRKEALEAQNRLLENSVTIEEAIAHAKDIRDFSGDAAKLAEGALGAQEYQTLSRQYAQQYGQGNELLPTDINAEIDAVKAKKSDTKKGSKENQELDKQLKLLEKIQKAEKTAVTSKKAYAKSAKDLQEKISGLTNSSDKNNKTTQEAQNKIIELKKKYPDFEAQLKKVAEGTDLNEKETKEYTRALEAMASALRQSEAVAGEVAEAGEEQLEIIKRANEERERAAAEEAEERQKQAINAQTQAITTMIGAATQAYGIITSVVNIFKDGLNDNEKTFPEKMTSIFLSLIPVLFSIIPTVISVGKSLGIMGKEGEKAGWKTFIAGMKAQIGWWPFIIIMLILMAVLLALAGIFAVISAVAEKVGDNGKKAFEDASKAAESAKERFNEVKQAYDDLKKSIEDYNKAQDAIEELTKGTDEWKEAVAEANQQVIDLLDKYPELAQYISNVDGQLKVSEEGQEAVLKAQEDLVNQANRMRMTTSITKAKAENNMLRLEGANNALKVAMAEEAKERQDAYDTALDVIAQRGNAIIGDKTAFTEAMEAEGVAADLIDALWENKTELAKNSAEIAANNAAIKLQQQQIAASYLNDKSEVFQESENQSQISKIIAMQSNSDSQAYKDELEKLKTSDGVDKDSEAENIFKKYNTANDLGGTFKEFDKDSQTVTYVDENGDEKSISVDAMAQSLAQEKALEAAGTEGNIIKIEKALNTVADKFGKNIGERAGAAVSQFVAGETADLSALTKKELEEFDATAISAKDLEGASDNKKNQIAQSLGYDSYNDLDQHAKDIGYENASAYLNAMQDAVNNYKYEEERILVGLNEATKNAFNNLKEQEFTKEWSLNTQKAVANSLEQAFENAGPAATTALKDLYAKLGDSVDEEDMQALANATKDIDWTSSGALMEFNNQIKELGINIPEDQLESFTDQMSELVNVVNDVVNNFSELQKKLKEIGDLTKELKLGDTLSAEDYENLIKYNKGLEDYFVLTVDGYKYLGGADEQIKAAKTSVLSIDKINSQFSAASVQGQRLLSDEGKEMFDRNAKISSTKRASVEKIVGAGSNYTDLLAASGYSQEQLTDALNKGIEKSTFLTDKTLSEIAGKSVEDLVGEDADEETKQKAQKAIDDANKQMKAAENMIQSAYSAIAGNLNAIEDGSFDEKRENAIALSVSSLASSYDELKLYQKEFAENSKAYHNLAKVYLAEEAAALGINAIAWEEIAKKELDEQEAILDRRKILQSYDEIDFYKKYEDSIDSTNKKLDALSETQENLTGKKAIKNLKEQIELQKDLAEVAKDRFEEEQKELSLRKADLSDVYGDSLANMGIAIAYSADGTVSNETRDALLAKLADKNLSDEERDYVEAILADIDSYNDKVIESLDAYQEAFANSVKAMSDAALQIFDQELNIKINFAEVKKEIEDILREIEKISEGNAFSLFDEENATEMYENAYKEVEFLQGQLKATEEDFYNRVNSFNALQDWLGNEGNIGPAEVVDEKTGFVYTSNNIQGLIDAEKPKVGELRQKIDDILNSPNSQYNILKKEYDNKTATRVAAEAAENDFKGTLDAKETTKDNALQILNEKNAAEKSYLDKHVKWLFDETYGSKKNRVTFLEALGGGYSNYDDFVSFLQSNDSDNRQKALESLETALTIFSGDSTSWGDTMTTSNRKGAGNILKDMEVNFGAVNGALKAYKDAENAWVAASTDYSNAQFATSAAKTAEENAKTAFETEANKEGGYNDLWNDYEASQARVNDLNEVALKLEIKKTTQMEEALKTLDAGAEAYLVADMNAGTFGANIAKFEENMRESWDTFSGYYNDINEQLNAIYESWGAAQEEIMAAYDKEIEKRSTLNSLMSSAAELYTLAGKKGEGYAEKMSGYYEKMTINAKANHGLAKAQLEDAQAQYAAIKAQFDAGIANQSMMDTVEANYNTALENMMSTATEWADALKEQLSASLSATIDEFIAKSNELGLGLTEVQENWGRATALDDRYLDEVNAAYATDSLARNFQKSIDETDSYTAQKKLNSVMQEQLKILREKDKLSQYDIDRANAMYELTLKQIALEEAQNTANKMKLTRDASGNYSYQYVADQDAIAQAEEELAAAQNELYNLDKERQKSLVDDYYNIMSEAQEAISNASEENRENVARYYEELLTGIQSELGISTDNLNKMGEILTNSDWSAPFEDFVNAISKDNVDSLFTDIYEAIDGASGLNTIIDSALGANSNFNTGMTTLTNALNDPDTVKNLTEASKTTAENVIKNLPMLLEQQTALKGTVEAYQTVFKELETDAKSELILLGEIATSTASTAKSSAELLDSSKKNNAEDPSADTSGQNAGVT